MIKKDGFASYSQFLQHFLLAERSIARELGIIHQITRDARHLIEIIKKFKSSFGNGAKENENDCTEESSPPSFVNGLNHLKKLAGKTNEISVRKSGRSKRLNSTKYGGKTSDSQLKREKVFLVEEGQVQKTDENHLVETEEFLNSKLSCRESKVMLKRTEVLKNNSKHPIFMPDPNKRGTNQILSKHEDLNIADISKLAVSREVETNYAIRNAESKLDNKLVNDEENESNKSPKESDLEDG